MRIRKAVITAAGPRQRTLPLQSLIDRDGVEKSVLAILLEETLRARIEEIAIVIAPGDEPAYRRAAGEHHARLRFIEQSEPAGYAHAVLLAQAFTAGEAFLHLVSDHLCVSRHEKGCAERLVELAESENCAVSAVQPTREHHLPRYGAVAGPPVSGREGLYAVETVLEKPTPTEAEQRLIVPGLRAGHYLCFFGMHVLTPAVMEILRDSSASGASLSAALAALARRERYLALELGDLRYDLGIRYGLLAAQLALALSGKDRQEVLAQLLELLAARELDSVGH
jgi:UTP--glucose-1-phosphate uridylyltransferase